MEAQRPKYLVRQKKRNFGELACCTARIMAKFSVMIMSGICIKHMSTGVTMEGAVLMMHNVLIAER